jgi:hypothetical protein
MGARSGRDGGAERLAADDERGADCQGENAQRRNDAAEDDAPPPAPLDLVEQGGLLAFAHAAPSAQLGRCAQLGSWLGSLSESFGAGNGGGRGAAASDDAHRGAGGVWRQSGRLGGACQRRGGGCDVLRPASDCAAKFLAGPSAVYCLALPCCASDPFRATSY